MRVGVIGGGATGLAAAFELVRHGCEVELLEASDELGGLAGSVEVGGTPLERYYHHIFGSDRCIIDLIGELGLSSNLEFHAPPTGIYFEGQLHDFGTPLDILKFPPLPFADRVRFAGSSAYLKAQRNWARFEGVRALDWTRARAGKAATSTIWEPLLRGKFGDQADEVSMAWLWARIHSRTFKLGYLSGGFHQLYEALSERIVLGGGEVLLGNRVTSIRRESGRVAVDAAGQTRHFDRVIATVPQSEFAKLTGAEIDDLLWRNRYLAATCFILEMEHSLSPYYWLNINDVSFPFLAVVEHTQMIDKAVYGGRHVVYLGNYLPRDDWRYRTEPGELLEAYVPYLTRINSAFDRSWVTRFEFSRAPFAQPVVTTSYRASIPPHETSVEGVYLATMSQVYPQDRGQNYAVKMGREIAARLISEAT